MKKILKNAFTLMLGLLFMMPAYAQTRELRIPTSFFDGKVKLGERVSFKTLAALEEITEDQDYWDDEDNSKCYLYKLRDTLDIFGMKIIDIGFETKNNAVNSVVLLEVLSPANNFSMQLMNEERYLKLKQNLAKKLGEPNSLNEGEPLWSEVTPQGVIALQTQFWLEDNVIVCAVVAI